MDYQDQQYQQRIVKGTSLTMVVLSTMGTMSMWAAGYGGDSAIYIGLSWSLSMVALFLLSETHPALAAHLTPWPILITIVYFLVWEEGAQAVRAPLISFGIISIGLAALVTTPWLTTLVGVISVGIVLIGTGGGVQPLVPTSLETGIWGLSILFATALFLYSAQVINETQNHLLLAKEQAEKAELAEARARTREAAANQAKSVFLANMSHELRTPLNAILGYAQLLEQNVKSDYREGIQVIANSGAHLLRLINEILELSRIEAGQVTIHETDFDLQVFLNDLQDMFALKAREKGLQIIVEGPLDLRYVRTDERKLRQILVNLINNAIKFTSEGGVAVRVAWKADEGCLHFEIQDSGVGIVEGDLDTLFDPFVQTEAGQRAEEGTGLGLPISQRFVELMGGSLSVSSEVGEGTTFRFAIPVVPTDSLTPPRQKPRRHVTSLAPGQQQYRILVVEDHEASRRLLIRMLEQIGFEVREAINGQEGIAVWEEWDPHLIWMDMRMPVMSGYEATRHIKATARGERTRVIALTASAFENDRQRVLDAGCDDFVRKPLVAQRIYEVLSRHLGVQFIYDTENEKEVPEQEIEVEVESIPSQIREALRQAAQVADYARCSQILDDYDLNGPLRQLLANYEFTALEQLLRQGDDV